jgi:predicted ATP-binding protein involved in virulence
MKVSSLRTKDIGDTNIVVDWDKLTLSLEQLSEGQRNLLLLVSDISFSLLNVQEIRNSFFSDNPDTVLQREGIVLIDEIELHLHPQWQREVLPALQKTFPNIQFIVTTHSPQVLSNLKKEEVFILKDNKIVEVTPHIEGRDSNSILSELFGVDERPERFKNQLKQLYNAIDDENLSEAKKILAELTVAFGEQDTEIVRANLHLSFAEE